MTAFERVEGNAIYTPTELAAREAGSEHPPGIPAEAEIQIHGGYMVKYRLSKVEAGPHVRILVWLGEDEDHYRLTGTLVMLRAEADAFMREVSGHA